MPVDGKMQRPRINLFWSVVLTILLVLLLIKWIIPAVSRQITGLPFPLTVPGTLVFMYMTLTVIALYLYVTYSDESLHEFLQPVYRFMRGENGTVPRLIVMIAVPLIVGWQVFEMRVPKQEPPVTLRIQHPSSNFPRKFENLKNPYGKPTPADVEAFVEQARSGEVMLLEQLRPDVAFWQEEHPDEPMLAAINTPMIKQFLAELDSGDVSRETAGAAWVEKNLFEGRALYAMNCRPCHGDSVAGDGPMADGFKLRPINFTDTGTLETIVEGYTFWRVENGGPGLPTEATPWDSAMPEWKLNLSEEERWKIILAEYNLAGKTPRLPESH